METLIAIMFFSLLAAAYIIPAFVFAFLVTAAYGAATKRIKGIRTVIRKSARLTPVLVVVYFAGLYGLQYISKPHTLALEDVTADNFKLSSYYVGSPSLQKTVDKIFPLGTPKDQIDRILVEREGAEISEGTRPSDKVTGARYKHRAWPWSCFPWGGKPVVSIYAEFDPQLKLTYLLARQVPNGCSYL